jgi:hypothetical protein
MRKQHESILRQIRAKARQDKQATKAATKQDKPKPKRKLIRYAGQEPYVGKGGGALR